MRDLHRPGRSVAQGARGAAATSHQLATHVALEVLRSGGNAIDAAITACALQGVIEPHNTGIGGDCFALIWKADEAKLHAINGSGWAPRGLDCTRLAAAGETEIAPTSIHATTVPGAVDAWDRLLRDHGTHGFAEVLAPAIDYAETGFVLAERTASDWNREVAKLLKDEGARAHLLNADGTAPKAGDIVRFPALARTLRTLAAEGRDAFYKGAIARTLVGSLNALGGFHDASDFAEYSSLYVTPISTRYRGVDCVQIPPSGQGLTALVMLNILSGFDIPADPFGSDRFHLQIEASRLAYHVRDSYLADPAFADVPVANLLSQDFASRLRGRIDPHRAMPATLSMPHIHHRDTVYVTVVDAQGNVCSLINSLFHAFGSGKVCPKTGVAFQSRGSGFRVVEGHPNAVGPRKRPLHTIIPGLAMRDGKPWLSFGVMGGAYQPVGQVHVLQNLVDYGLDVQEALDAPRGFRSIDAFDAERGVSDAVLLDLAERGHPIRRVAVPWGGGQAIVIDAARGVLSAGSDPRKDGCALAY